MLLVVILIGLGLVGYFLSLPEVRVAQYRSIFGHSDEQARRKVFSSAYLAGLCAARITWILALFSMFVIEGPPKIGVEPIAGFLVAIGLGLASGLVFYARHSRGRRQRDR